MTSRRFGRSTFAILALAWVVGCTDQPTSLLDGDDDDGPGATSAQGSGGSTTGSGTGAGQGGGASGTGGQTAAPATFEITWTDPTPDMELRSTLTVDVEVAANGYTGSVALSLTGVPSDVTASLDASSVALTGSGTETVTLTLTTESDTTAGALPISVVGTVPGGTKSGPATLTVLPVITIYIPQNLSSFAGQNTAFGDFPTVIQALPNMSASNTITVKFFNSDTVDHEIHAMNGTDGFGHGNQSIPPMSFDPVVREVNSPGTYTYYPHDLVNGDSILGQVVIQ